MSTIQESYFDAVVKESHGKVMLELFPKHSTQQLSL